jgi:hypothetical protein
MTNRNLLGLLCVLPVLGEIAADKSFSKIARLLRY